MIEQHMKLPYEQFPARSELHLDSNGIVVATTQSWAGEADNGRFLLPNEGLVVAHGPSGTEYAALLEGLVSDGLLDRYPLDPARLLDELREHDPYSEFRQVGILYPGGAAAAMTGSACPRGSSHRLNPVKDGSTRPVELLFGAESASPDRATTKEEREKFWKVLSNAQQAHHDSERTALRVRLDALDASHGDHGPAGSNGPWIGYLRTLAETGWYAIDSQAWNHLCADDPQLVYHIVHNEDPCAPESLRTEGFVHCSFAHQLPPVIRRFYPGVQGIEAIEIDRALLGAGLRIEDSYNIGEEYPHFYGPIPRRAIRRRGLLSDLIPWLGL